MKAIRRIISICCVPSVFAATLAATTEESRLSRVKHKIFSGPALARSAAGAGIAHLRDHPYEWGGGAAGYAKRFASSIGTHAVNGTIEMGVGQWHHEDNHYYPSGRSGTWPRLKFAVANTFVVHRENQPGRTPAIGRLSGAFGAGLISRAWQPATTAGIGMGFASGGIAVAADVGLNVAREFWPRHPKQERKRPGKD